MVATIGAASGSTPDERSEKGAVRALVDCIKKEETTVVVNLDERIQACLLVYHAHVVCSCKT
jgi:hypothetical protein